MIEFLLALANSMHRKWHCAGHRQYGLCIHYDVTPSRLCELRQTRAIHERRLCTLASIVGATPTSINSSLRGDIIYYAPWDRPCTITAGAYVRQAHAAVFPVFAATRSTILESMPCVQLDQMQFVDLASPRAISRLSKALEYCTYEADAFDGSPG